MDDVNGLGKEVQYLQIKGSRSYPQRQNKHMYIFYTYSMMNIIYIYGSTNQFQNGVKYTIGL